MLATRLSLPRATAEGYEQERAAISPAVELIVTDYA
jgi:hypothetical protein